MPGDNLFTPNTAGTVSITSGTVSARVALITAGNVNAVRVKNVDATNIAYISFGNATVTATVPSGSVAGAVPIGAGETAGFSLGAGQTYASAICTAGTPLVFFTPGNGL